MNRVFILYVGCDNDNYNEHSVVVLSKQNSIIQLFIKDLIPQLGIECGRSLETSNVDRFNTSKSISRVLRQSMKPR